MEAAHSVTKQPEGPVLFHSLQSLIPFHSSYIPFIGGIFLPIFATFFETAIALEVASGDSFVAGTEPDMEPDISFLYYIMWELAVIWPGHGSTTLWATLSFIGH